MKQQDEKRNNSYPPLSQQIVPSIPSSLPLSTSSSRLGWYWWIKGRYLSDTPRDFLPTSDDTLEQIAWSSIKYDHLGGPNTEHVLLTHLRPGELRNPNRAWDMSISAGPIMKRVFKFENLLHLITVLMHVLVLFPLTSTYLQTTTTTTAGSPGNNQVGIVPFLLNRLINRIHNNRR